MKKGFTLAELLITLVIIGVIIAINSTSKVKIQINEIKESKNNTPTKVEKHYDYDFTK